MNSVNAAASVAQAGLSRLQEEVIQPGWCVACGACLGLCPHLIFYDGQVAAPDACTLAQGRCYDLCPQALHPDQEQKRAQLLTALGRPFAEPIGPVKEAWWAVSKDAEIKGKAQYGGVVSTLTVLALENGLVQEAVLTRADQRGAPQGVRVHDRQGVQESAGSIYAGGGTLSALNQTLAEPADHKVMLVGLPCQSLAAASMAAHPEYPAAAQRLELVIGLFCTLNMRARTLRDMLEQSGVKGPIIKSDFPPPPAGVFQVTTGQGMTEIPLDEVYRAVMPGCSLCPDLTAELADLSVGAAEGQPGLNLILVRSDKGAELLKEARDKGLLELTEPHEESMDHLREAAASKRARAKAAAGERASG
jgi:coenzyme F420 hydrogenase subunit beta